MGCGSFGAPAWPPSSSTSLLNRVVDMDYVVPEFSSEAFHCPYCGTYAHMTWFILYEINSRQTNDYHAVCARCNKASLWRVYEYENNGFDQVPSKVEMVSPDINIAPVPDADMPNEVKYDYLEAGSVFSRSPRASAALLRLGLQKLCKHLGEPGNNINDDLRSLASKNVLPPLVIKVADTVRITGNNAVHPGEMDPEDIDYVASKMFELLNFIVRKAITEPKELKALYEKVPERPRKAAEAKDDKSRSADS